MRLRVRVPVTDGGESDDHEPHARAHVGEGLGVGGPRVGVKVAELDVLKVEYGRAEEYRAEEEEDERDDERLRRLGHRLHEDCGVGVVPQDLEKSEDAQQLEDREDRVVELEAGRVGEDEVEVERRDRQEVDPPVGGDRAFGG